MNNYIAWKADIKCNPIENTEKHYSGKSKRDVLQHIAFEEGVEYQRSQPIVRLANGEFWCVTKI